MEVIRLAPIAALAAGLSILVVPAAVAGPITKQNGFEATFQNLQAATFDTAHMGLDPTKQLTASLTVSSGPGAFTLGIDGAFGAVTATLDSAPVTVTHTASGIELALTLSAGQHQLVVSP